VAADISCTRQHRTYVEVAAVWCGAMYRLLFFTRISVEAKNSRYAKSGTNMALQLVSPAQKQHNTPKSPHLKTIQAKNITKELS